MGPLEGIRVLDLTSDVAGPYATKLLAEYGADVLKVEPPGGDPTRQFGPFPRDVPDPEASGLFLHLNTGKRSVELDLAHDDGAGRVRELAADTDILIEDLGPGEAERLGIDWQALSASHPSLVV